MRNFERKIMEILELQINNLQNYFADKDSTLSRIAAFEKAVSFTFLYFLVETSLRVTEAEFATNNSTQSYRRRCNVYKEIRWTS